MAKSIMIQGTMSNAGKSLLAGGLCRIFHQDGYRVAPFKSQNMALNSFITDAGFEMGRAQVMQAEAAGIAPDVRMNPILLKPTGDMGSQVIVNGEVLDNMKAADYYAYKHKLRPAVQQAYDSLASEYDIIVIEGAGSPAEINLKEDDFVNMGMARMVGAPVLLAGDIDRGGVFASLYGTVALLEPEEQAHIKGLIINKFRGDVEILCPGLKMLEDLVHKPVLGVVPMLQVDIDEEDSLSSKLNRTAAVKALDLAVIRLPRLSNFTDFDALERFDCAGVRYVHSAAELGNPDLILLPGTKNTMDDLLWMRQNGLEGAICKLHRSGTPIFAICGGYQMLGKELRDPLGVEHGGTLRGMGLLDSVTEFRPEKTRTRVSGQVNGITGFWSALSGSDFTGYEIHMGATNHDNEGFSVLSNGGRDGAVKGTVLGSYVHGIFDEGDLAQRVISILLERKGLDLDSARTVTFQQYKEQQYDILADGIRRSLDMDAVYKILEQGMEG